MKIVIIEDEILTSEDLRNNLISLNCGIEISAILPTVKHSIEYFSTNSDYNLIFSDIGLGDGHSFEIFKKVSVSSPIIFCRAHNQYALEAFKTNGIDYILKPFDETSVASALNKYHLLKGKFTNPQIDFTKLESFTPKMKKIQSLIVNQGDKILPIPLVNISSFQLKNYVVRLHTFDGGVFTISQSLDELESKLGPEFYRINRQFIINRKIIKDVSRHAGRKLFLNLMFPFPEELIISREKTPHFLEWLAEN